MLKKLSYTTKIFAVLIMLVVVIMAIVISISGNKAPVAQAIHYIHDNAADDNKVEALKMMTADLIHVEHKNKILQKNIDQLEAAHQASVKALQQSIDTQIEQAVNQLKAQNDAKQQLLEEQFKQKAAQTNIDYPIEGAAPGQQTNFIWVKDLSHITPSSADENKSDEPNNLLAADNHFFPSQHHEFNNNKHQAKQRPVYTIPVNATLTGATLMTPLIGRIPINGELPSPYQFKLVLSADNLTANGYPMPGVKGAVMSGVASGDLLGSCARGKLESITFIFNNGRISTTEAKGNQGLGYISSQTGNPCIAGRFHSNAAVFLGAQMGLAGIQGYANALTDSQYMNSTTSDGVGIQNLIGSANKAAIGQGTSAAAQAAQTWWNQRVQNSFDYVFVPNVNPKTGRIMKVVVNITKQIEINDDQDARKVSYENFWQNHHTRLD